MFIYGRAVSINSSDLGFVITRQAFFYINIACLELHTVDLI